MEPRILQIRVSAPASIANLGAGFDCLAMALDLRNQYHLHADIRAVSTGEAEFKVELGGTYAQTDARMRVLDGNLFIKAFQDTRKYLCTQRGLIVPQCPIMITEVVEIPPVRGLGSSSSACIAGMLAAIKFLEVLYPDEHFEKTLESDDYCASLAMVTDSCPDNLCACLSGGLTYSFKEAEERDGLELLHYFREEIRVNEVRVVALIPEVELSTPAARRALENEKYSVQDVAFNITRSTSIPAVFRHGKWNLLAEVMMDKIHQDQRARVFYKGERKDIDLKYIFEKTIQAGAYSACISGAGSSLVAFAPPAKVEAVKIAFRAAFMEKAKDPWKIDSVRELSPTNERAKIEVFDHAKSFAPSVMSWIEERPALPMPVSIGPIVPPDPVPPPLPADGQAKDAHSKTQPPVKQPEIHRPAQTHSWPPE
jgi:homoserine kinase